MSEAAAMAVRSTDVLGALSLAADMAMGLRAGHGVRGTYICMQIADALALPDAQRADLYYAALLMDAGCTAWASQTAAMVLGDDVAARRALFFLTDRTDPRDLLCSQPFFLEVLHQFGGRDAALNLARRRRGKSLDPDVVDAFVSLAEHAEFWRGLEDESVRDLVRQMEPESPYRLVTADRLVDTAAAFADFADLKSFYTAGHSRRVAALATRIATDIGLPGGTVQTIQVAALLHDLGVVAVPSFVLHKAHDRLTAAEWESLRLHPYHGERIVAHVPAFAAAGELIAMHHERPDGRGYPRGVRGEQIPVGARVIAVADAFDELTHARPDGPALSDSEAVDLLRRDSGSRFDASALSALIRVLQLPDVSVSLAPPAKRQWPADLTDREVDVLRLLATGANRRDIARQLVVSEHTVRHHLCMAKCRTASGFAPTHVACGSSSPVRPRSTARTWDRSDRWLSKHGWRTCGCRSAASSLSARRISSRWTPIATGLSARRSSRRFSPRPAPSRSVDGRPRVAARRPSGICRLHRLAHP